MKRRILAFALALVLACSMSTVALAESKDVTVKVIQEDVRSTGIDWAGFDFIYTFDSKNGNKWSHTQATVTVRNNAASNVSIDVSSIMETSDAITDFGDVLLTYDAVPATLDPNEKITYTVTISGAPDKNLSVDPTTIGTITVFLS